MFYDSIRVPNSGHDSAANRSLALRLRHGTLVQLEGSLLLTRVSLVCCASRWHAGEAAVFVGQTAPRFPQLLES